MAGVDCDGGVTGGVAGGLKDGGGVAGGVAVGLKDGGGGLLLRGVVGALESDGGE